jgi:hypothetical protein
MLHNFWKVLQEIEQKRALVCSWEFAEFVPKQFWDFSKEN